MATTMRVRDRAHVDLLVLATLAEGARSGYEVRDALAERVGDSVSVPETRIFPTLHRLARNRLVRREHEGSRRYVLTDVGRRSLEARAAGAVRYAEAVRTLRDGVTAPASSSGTRRRSSPSRPGTTAG
jgi:DNA-binding PadR family transcriptional regulator